MNNLTVLYVEDDELCRKLFGRFLTLHVDSVFTAQDGREGLNTFIACRPDLVISDVDMPVMDGVAMAARIRAIHPGIPIAFLTASPEKLAGFAEFDPRIDRIFSKPIDMWEFSRFLENHPVVHPKFALPAVCHA